MLGLKLFHANGSWKPPSKMDLDQMTQAVEEQRRIFAIMKSQVQRGEWWLDGEIRIALGNIANLEEA